MEAKGRPVRVGGRDQERASVELLREGLIAVLAHEEHQERVLLLVREQERRVGLGVRAEHFGAQRAELRGTKPHADWLRVDEHLVDLRGDEKIEQDHLDDHASGIKRTSP